MGFSFNFYLSTGDSSYVLHPVIFNCVSERRKMSFVTSLSFLTFLDRVGERRDRIGERGEEGRNRGG